MVFMNGRSSFTYFNIAYLSCNKHHHPVDTHSIFDVATLQFIIIYSYQANTPEFGYPIHTHLNPDT